MTRAREREVMTRPVNRRRMETARRSEEVISGGENVGKGRRDDVPRGDGRGLSGKTGQRLALFRVLTTHLMNETARME